MTTEEEIRDVIQQIGGILILKNIPSVPVNLEYLEEKVAPGMEKLIVTQLIMHLEDLLLDYYQEEKKVHKYSRYVHSFRNHLDENSDGDKLVGKAKRTA